MKRTVLGAFMTVAACGMLAAPVARLRAEESKKPAPGVYFEEAGKSGSAALTRIPGGRPEQVKTKGLMKMIATQGLAKASTVVALAGTIADVRTAETAPVFIISLPEAPGSTAMPADPLAAYSQMMSGDAMPPGARTGADFQLVQLTVTADSRQAELGKVGSQGGKMKNSVDMSEERVMQGEYRLRPKQALKPGEYAFFVQNGGVNGAAATAWAFGVDAKK
jgi:hypothetical protein